MLGRLYLRRSQSRFDTLDLGLPREDVAKDLCHALLILTATGRAAYDDLSKAAAHFDRKLQEWLGEDDVQALKRCLRALMKNP